MVVSFSLDACSRTAARSLTGGAALRAADGDELAGEHVARRLGADVLDDVVASPVADDDVLIGRADDDAALAER
jgi:hypothetical protein